MSGLCCCWSDHRLSTRFVPTYISDNLVNHLLMDEQANIPGFSCLAVQATVVNPTTQPRLYVVPGVDAAGQGVGCSPKEGESVLYFFEEPNPLKPIIFIISSSSFDVAKSLASSVWAFSFSACFCFLFSALRTASFALISASRCSKSYDLAFEASFVFSRSICIRARTCSTVDREIFVVWPRARKSVVRE